MGFEAAPIDVIAEDAGYSRGAFYSNFDSKDELFVELLGRHLDAEVDTLSRALDRIKTAKDLAPAIERRYQVLGEDSVNGIAGRRVLSPSPSGSSSVRSRSRR